MEIHLQLLAPKKYTIGRLPAAGPFTLTRARPTATSRVHMSTATMNHSAGSESFRKTRKGLEVSVVFRRWVPRGLSEAKVRCWCRGSHFGAVELDSHTATRNQKGPALHIESASESGRIGYKDAREEERHSCSTCHEQMYPSTYWYVHVSSYSDECNKHRGNR